MFRFTTRFRASFVVALLALGCLGFAQSAQYPRVSALLRKLSTKDDEAASAKLQAIGLSALPDIIHYLDVTPGMDRDFDSRAALELSSYGPEAKPVFLKCLASGGLRSRIAVLFSLSYMASILNGAQEVPDDMSADLLSDPDMKEQFDQAQESKKRYSWMRDPDATAAWVHAIGDNDPAVKFCAITIVGFFRLPDAHLALQKALSSKDEKVWNATFSALVRFGRVSDAGMLAESIEARSKLGSKNPIDSFGMMVPLTRRDTALGPAILRKLLNSSSPDLRGRAVRLLGLHGDPSDIPAIEALFNDPSADVRSQALVAAAHTAGKGGEKYVPMLLDLSNSKSLQMRKDAMQGLGEVGGDGPLKRLSEFAKDKDPEIRRDAAQAMAGMYDPRCKPILEELLKDRDAETHMNAQMALDNLKMTPQQRAQGKAAFDQMMSAEPSFVLQDPPRSPSLAVRPKKK